MNFFNWLKYTVRKEVFDRVTNSFLTDVMMSVMLL